MNRFAVLALATSACIDLTLPDLPPPPGPGSIQGTVVFAVPGRSGYRPAGGARVTLIESGISTVANQETGRFDLRDVRISSGLLLFEFDLERDGRIDRQRVLELTSIGAGLGRNVTLGEVVLARNATVSGRVLRGDNPLETGHGGTAVFVPGAPYATATADTGEFVLENLPQGPLQLAFFRDGYVPESREVTTRGGEETETALARLVAAPSGMGPALATGLLLFEGDVPVAGARLTFVSPRTTFTTTTDSNGAFSVQAMSTGLYQVGIEAEGAVTLRLYNVLLLPGANELGAVAMTRGVSTPLSIDAGPLVPFDAGVATTAIIDPPAFELAPGGSRTLSGARSTGERPLSFRWRSAGDGGLQVTFDAPDTGSPAVRVFAPDASGRYPFTLAVTDALGTTSPPARGEVRVGLPPSVTVRAIPGTTVAPGATVTLQAVGVSTDGRPISAYAWTQRTGPALNVPLPAGDTVTFAAPGVGGLTPMSFEVVALTDLGFTSAPALITLALQPVTRPTLVVRANPATVTIDGGLLLIELLAEVVGGPPDAGFMFTWSPAADGCPLGDGGKDVTCPDGWTLSNPTSTVPSVIHRTEFFAPRPSGDRVLDFTVTAMPGGLTEPTQVVIRDGRAPQCQSTLSPLSYQLRCDEPIVIGAARFDAGVPGLSAAIVADGGLVMALFNQVLAPGSYAVELTGLVDGAGNAIQPMAPMPFQPLLSVTGPWVTPPGSASTTETRPTWMSLDPGNGQPARWVIVGRRTDATNRMVWVLAPTAPCAGVCMGVVTQEMSIPGLGIAPSAATSAVSVQGRGYVMVSKANPPGLVEYRNGAWLEIMPSTSPPTLNALGTNGVDLWVLGTNSATGNVEALMWQPTVNMYSSAAPLSNAGMLLESELTFSPTGTPFALLAGIATVFQWGRTSTTWGPVAPINEHVFQPGASHAKAVMLGAQLSQAVGASLGTNFSVSANGASALPLGTAVGTVTHFDMARFGDGALIVMGSSAKTVQLVLVSRSAGGFNATDVTLPDGGVNLSPNQATRPRIIVDGANIRLAWEESVGANFGMGGIIIR
jgi:hypothetical protein